MENRLKGIRIAAAVMMIAFLLAVSSFAMAEADPIRVSSLCEPQSVVSEQEVSITIKIYNSSQQDMTETITLFGPDGYSVDKYEGLKGEQSVTYTGTWNVTAEEIERGRINYYIRYNVETANGPTQTTRTVPVTIQTEEAAPQLTATYTITPMAAREGQTVNVAYTLSNTGNIELRNISVENEGITDETLTAASLSVGEKITLESQFTMGSAELVSEPTITYQAAGSDATLSLSDMARRTVTLAEDGLEVEISAENTENLYPGERVAIAFSIKNSGETPFTNLVATLSDGTPIASGIELAAGASFEQEIEWSPTEDGSIFANVSGLDESGETVMVSSNALDVTTQDSSTALILHVTTQAQSTVIYSEPAVVRFGLLVENIGQTDAATLTVQEAGTTVATIPSLPAGESRTLVFDIQTSVAGQIQFTVVGRDAMGNERSYASNIVQLTYMEPTPAPTAAPTATPVPPTPSPAPTATPVPSIGEMISQHVNPVVLYLVAGVLAAAIIAVIGVQTVSSAKRKKRMEQALDTIERSPDVRDSFGRRRRQPKSAKKPREEKKPEEPIVPTPELTEEEANQKSEETMTPARDAMRRFEREEGHRRRMAEGSVSTEKTLRVAPVEERPDFVAQGKVDDSQTRIFGKLSASEDGKKEGEPPQEKPDAAETADAQETIRLGREEMEEIRQGQQRRDVFGASGKKRSEIKPMKKKKGLFGRAKDEDDDFVEDYEQADEDDDFFE